MIVALIIGAYLLCGMVAFSILAYRNAGDEPGEIVGALFAAPLGMAYQVGCLIREKQR